MEIKNKRSLLLILLGVSIAIFTAVAAYFLLFGQKKQEPSSAEEKHTQAYYLALLEDNPAALQSLFLEDVRAGVNTADTKSTAYYILPRYFDNGGDIYEIYNFINAHPELAFLNEYATKSHPETIKQIQAGTFQHTFHDAALLVSLSYMEAMAERGYADVAMHSTIANQYAKLAYLAVLIKRLAPKDAVMPEFVKTRPKKFPKKSAVYMEQAKDDVRKIVDGDIPAIPTRDVIVGLNQYASALRYLEYLKYEFDSPKTASEIFVFSTDYAKRYVPELRIFTGYLNASTMVFNGKRYSQEQISVALEPILEVNPTDGLRRGGLLGKVLASRSETVGKIAGTDIDDDNLDLYGKRNVVLLARRVPAFKSWLMAGGWTEADFKL